MDRHRIRNKNAESGTVGGRVKVAVAANLSVQSPLCIAACATGSLTFYAPCPTRGSADFEEPAVCSVA